jgi:hypothetical protein
MSQVRIFMSDWRPPFNVSDVMFAVTNKQLWSEFSESFLALRLSIEHRVQ